MIILGIDPGFERLGIAILEKDGKKEKIIFSTCFKTSSKMDFSMRLKLIGEEIEKILKKYQPEMLAIENLFFTTNQKTAMRVAEVRGTILFLCSKKNMKIFEATPLQIKMAITGYGKAQKEAVIKMVKMLVTIDPKKKSDDELDAIAIALTASAYQKI